MSKQVVKGRLADKDYANFQKTSKGPLIAWLKQKQGGSECQFYCKDGYGLNVHLFPHTRNKGNQTKV